ncbi:YbjN domain-containing protein [Epibacterium ulvae]|uniref:YbjN domain-containing protein n=1 Tax=Epibacterium ulvae TaxID=1156985 RepID=UPI00248F8653|nr:YbjN domain-containing protein [Epibacterium ulvae]
MSLSEHQFYEETHPIDVVEHLAAGHDWEFDRIAEDQIAMAIEGQWRTYSLTLAWSDPEETLRLVCSFEMDPPQNRMSELYELINKMNDECWTGSFTYWPEHKLMLYRYGLLLTGGLFAGSQQIDKLLNIAVSNCERFYPAIQMNVWGEQTPTKAMQVAIAEGYGRA